MHYFFCTSCYIEWRFNFLLVFKLENDFHLLCEFPSYFSKQRIGACWAGRNEKLTSMFRLYNCLYKHLYSSLSFSNWPTISENVYQLWGTNCKDKCWVWRKKLNNTKISDLMIPPWKPKPWCSEFGFFWSWSTTCFLFLVRLLGVKGWYVANW